MKRIDQGSLFEDEEPASVPQGSDTAGDAPLAARMRPRTLAEYGGQEHLVGPGRVLRRAVEAGRLPSMILWGPPGSGKTTLARLLADAVGAVFTAVSAVGSGVADLRAAVVEARKVRQRGGPTTVLFVDEVHRLNKGQQDVLLPHVEAGEVVLIGATTENPSFEVNKALLSRTQVYALQPLGDAAISALIGRALTDTERGLGGRAQLPEAARAALVEIAGGDARVALTALDLAASLAGDGGEITVDLVREALQRRAQYDRAGDAHFDIISAFIKSIRGSDPDAAIYWLLRMIDAGEDAMFLARRLVIVAAEDIGLADPHALMLATAAQQAVHLIGMPEGYYPLAEATLYLACAPKSDSAGRARELAMHDVESTRGTPVPLHLRNAPTALMAEHGYGKGYRSAHEAPDHFDARLRYLPEVLSAREPRYYVPGELGAEAKIKARIEELRARRAQAK